jgi:O-antigen ligase
VPAPASDLSAAGRVAYAFLWLFVLSFPAEKAFEIPGLGTVSRLFGLLALGAGVLAAIADRRLRPLSRTHAALAVFVLWATATVRWSLAPDDTAVKVQTYLQLLGMAWLVWEFCPTEARIAGIMRAYVFGTFYADYDTFHRWLGAHATYYQRYAAAGFDPNDLALTLALSLPLSFYLARRARRSRAWIYWLQMALAFLTILLSASRTGFLTACLAATIVPLGARYMSRTERRLIALGLAAAVTGAMAVIPATSWKRLSTIGAEVSSGSLNSRTLIWSAGWQEFRERPLAGAGAGAYPRAVEPVMGWPTWWRIVAHNTFFSVLVETGIVGFALFATVLGMLVAAVKRMAGLDRLLWAVMLAVWTVGVNTLSWEIRKPTWLLFALVLATARLGAKAVTAGPPRRYSPAPEVVLP